MKEFAQTEQILPFKSSLPVKGDVIMSMLKLFFLEMYSFPLREMDTF